MLSTIVAVNIRKFTDNYAVVGFGFAWGMLVTPLGSVAALILGIAWIVQLTEIQKFQVMHLGAAR